MKKILPIAALLTVTSFVSCKKDYNCTCYYSTNGVTDHSDFMTIHDTKKNAESACSQRSTRDVFNGLIVVKSCSIK